MLPSEQDQQGGTSAPGRAKILLLQACDDQLVGRMREAAEGFAGAIDEGDAEVDRPVVAEAMRRLAVLHQLRSEPQAAHDYAQQSLMLAQSIGEQVLAAEAL